MSKTKYTFTYDQADERKFASVLDRLDPDEYDMLERRRLVNPDEPRYSDIETDIAMDPESALTFRLGMKHLKIRRERTEEELAEEAEIKERNTVRITVKVPGLDDDSSKTP